MIQWIKCSSVMNKRWAFIVSWSSCLIVVAIIGVVNVAAHSVLLPQPFNYFINDNVRNSAAFIRVKDVMLSVAANVSFNLIHAPTIRRSMMWCVWSDDDTFYWNTKCHTTCDWATQHRFAELKGNQKKERDNTPNSMSIVRLNRVFATKKWPFFFRIVLFLHMPTVSHHLI